MIRRVTGLIVLTFIPLLVVGCGPSGNPNLPKTVTASGTVTLDGTPVDGAQVVFIDESGTKSATASSDKSGHFSLDAFPNDKKGAEPGSYKVQVSKTIEKKLGTKNSDGGENTTWEFGLPKKYSSISSSGLKHAIPDGGSRDIKIDLSTK